MNDALENFFSSRLPIVGLVAYSIQLPDRALATQCVGKSFYPSAAEHMLTGVVRGSRTLLPAGQSAARYCWVFECLRVYVAARADGACLALLVENSPGVQMLRIQETLQAFGELPEI
jgi:hypothetical protein